MTIEWESRGGQQYGSGRSLLGARLPAAVRELVLTILCAVIFGRLAAQEISVLMELPKGQLYPTAFRAALLLVPMFLLCQFLGSLFPDKKLVLGIAGLLAYYVPVCVWVWGRAGRLALGMETWLKKYIGLFNDYYKTSYSLGTKGAVAAGGLSPETALSELFFILLLLLGALAAFCGSRFLQGSPLYLTLALLLLVGKKPPVSGAVLAFSGLLLTLDRDWDILETAECRKASGFLKRLGREALRLLLLLALAFVLPRLCSQGLGKAPEQLAERGEELKYFQKDLEERLDNYMALYYRGGYEQVSNRKPHYKEKEMLSVSISGGTLSEKAERKAYLSAGMHYLRGFYGIYYNRGRWTSDEEALTDACLQEGIDQKRLSVLLAQTGCLGMQGRKEKELPKGSHYSRFENRISYTGSRSRVAFLPYGMILDQTGEGSGAKAVSDKETGSFYGESGLKRKISEREISALSWYSPLDSFDRLWQLPWERSFYYRGKSPKVTKEYGDGDALLWLMLSQEEGFRAAESDSRIMSWYNGYVMDQYTSLAQETEWGLLPYINAVRNSTEAYRALQERPDEKSSFVTFKGKKYYAGPSTVVNSARLALARQVRLLLSDYRYSLELDRLPEGRDPVFYFLEQGKRGYCVHFASAGVLILRGLGIPARFASGYGLRGSRFRKGEGDSWSASVSDSDAHAWAEVYLDNIGWVPVEMTPGQDGDPAAAFDDGQQGQPSSRKRSPETEEAGGETAVPERPTESRQSSEQKESESQATQETEETTESRNLGAGKGKKRTGGSTVPWRTALGLGISILFLGAVLAVLLSRLKKRRLMDELLTDLRKRHNRRVVLKINRMVCGRLCSRCHRRPETLRDPEYGRLLAESYPAVSQEEWQQYMSVVMRAGFSDSEISAKEAAFCHGISRRISKQS